MIELLIGAAALAGAAAGAARRRVRERHRDAEILQRHQTAMRIDQIRREAEDEMLRTTRDYIDCAVVEDE